MLGMIPVRGCAGQEVSSLTEMHGKRFGTLPEIHGGIDPEWPYKLVTGVVTLLMGLYNPIYNQ